MKCIYFIITKIFAIISIILLVRAFTNLPAEFLMLFFLNTVMVMIMFLINRYCLHREFYLPMYLALILPGLGTLVLSLMDVFEVNNKIARCRVRTNQNYLDTTVESGVAKATDCLSIDRESNILSAFDELKYADRSRKKEILIKIVTSEESQYMTKILKQAINDTDSEVKHYAATILVAIEEKYEKAIAFYRRAYEINRNAENALTLIREYENHLNYVIHDDATKRSVLLDLLDVLLEAKNIMLDDIEIEIKLMNLYNELNLYSKSSKILEEIELLYGNDERVLLSAMRFNFEKRDYTKVAEYARRLKALCLVQNEKRDRLVDFWISA